MKCVPPDSAASWFCPVPAAGRTDTQAAAPHARAKGGGASTLLIAERSASAPAGVQESLKMCSFTIKRLCERVLKSILKKPFRSRCNNHRFLGFWFGFFFKMILFKKVTVNLRT